MAKENHAGLSGVGHENRNVDLRAGQSPTARDRLTKPMSEPADIPQEAEDKEPSDLVAAAKLPAEFLKKFLDLLEDKVANPEDYVAAKITIGELRFLEKHRPELFAKPEDAKPVLSMPKDNDICETQRALAEGMRLHYQDKSGVNLLDFEIDFHDISEWQNGKSLGDRMIKPPASLETKRRKWSLKAYIAWFDATLWHKHKIDSAPENKSAAAQMSKGAMRDQAEIAASEMVIMQRDRLKHETDGLHILTATSARTGSGLGIVARNATRDLLEKQLPSKISIGLDVFISDEAARQAFIEKVRRDGVELFLSWQKDMELRFKEIIKQGTLPMGPKK
jgi:hypothetical protein